MQLAGRRVAPARSSEPDWLECPCVTPSRRPARPRRLRIYRVVVGLLDAILGLTARRDYRIPPLPRTGPLLVAPNHVSMVDPIAVAMAVVRAGRIPRFVITAEVMDLPVVGPVLRYFDHVALDRTRPLDPAVLEPVRRSLRDGECVVFYPEGAISKDAGYRPGRALPGLGRLSIELGVPVLPVAQWGAQHVVGRGQLAWLGRPPRRARVTVRGLALIQPPAEPAGALNSRRLINEVMAQITADLERHLPDAPISRRS